MLFINEYVAQLMKLAKFYLQIKAETGKFQNQYLKKNDAYALCFMTSKKQTNN